MSDQQCSPQDQSFGLKAPRGQKIVLVLKKVLVFALRKKSWEFQDFLLEITI